jgi:hypothetical protein
VFIAAERGALGRGRTPFSHDSLENEKAAMIQFPAYTYIPGKSPHPESDPAGHRHEFPHLNPGDIFDAQTASPHPAWQHALDLFDAGYYWESHEVWEHLWHSVGRKGVVAEFLKGLIKLAACGVKWREGKPQGAQGHARAAAAHFCRVQQEHASLCGLNLQSLIDFAARAELVEWDEPADSQAVRIFASALAECCEQS